MGKACFVPGCRTGYLTDRNERKLKHLPMPGLFKGPRDPELFKKWQQAIPRKDRTLGPRDSVCEYHFKEEDVFKYYEEKLFDGTIFRMKRDHIRLRKGAIPCIFSHVPGHSTYNNGEKRQRRTVPKKTSNLSKERKSSGEFLENSRPENETESLANEEESVTEDHHISGNILSESNILPQSVVEEPLTFDFLIANINMIETLNSWWKINVFEDFIVCGRFTPDYIMERKIIITKELTVKVYLKEKLCTIGSDIKVLTMEIVSKLIYRVEKTILCNGLENYDHCAGFLQGTFMCRKHNLCVNCIKWKRDRERAMKRKASSKYVELMKFHSNF